jgi:hypothetical protein
LDYGDSLLNAPNDRLPARIRENAAEPGAEAAALCARVSCTFGNCHRKHIIPAQSQTGGVKEVKVPLLLVAIAWELLSFVWIAHYLTMPDCYGAGFECPPLRLFDYVVMIFPALMPPLIWAAFWWPRARRG